MLNTLRRDSAKTRLVRSLYAAMMSRAREPAFFRDFAVADTIDGRFDMVALHAWLVFGRLATAGMPDVAQSLSDAIFVGFDEGLRDLGAGDMGMGRKMKQLGEAFNGRLRAYDAASDEPAMAAVIVRNVFRGDANFGDQALAIARYAIAARARLSACDPLSGTLEFGPLPQLHA